MAISYPLTPPATPGFVESDFFLSRVTTVFRGAPTRVEQVMERHGAVWIARYQLPPMTRAQAAPWIAFLHALRGQVGTFLGSDPDARTPLGVATGTPLVKGAAQTGNTLLADGWTPSVTGILKAGDMITIASTVKRLYQVVEDANSDGSGNATLSIEPVLRESPIDNAVIAHTNWTIPMRLVSDDIQKPSDKLKIFDIGFSAIEALNP